jgi:hypothetical protein
MIEDMKIDTMDEIIFPKIDQSHPTKAIASPA